MKEDTMEIPAANVGRARKLVADMRMHASGSAKEAWYTPDKWRELCDNLEACLPGAPEAAAVQGSAADLGRKMGTAAAGLLGLLPHAAQGQPVTVNVYVTTNGK